MVEHIFRALLPEHGLMIREEQIVLCHEMLDTLFEMCIRDRFLLVVETIGSFQVFTPVQIMTNGGPGYSTTTIVTYLYQKGFQEYKMGMASAIAVIMFVILLFLSILQNKATSER